MNVRNILLTAAIATLAACGSRDDNTPDSGLPTGCTGACTDSGTPDSGTPDAGQVCNAFTHNSDRPTLQVSTDPDSGTVMTIAQLRYGRAQLADGGTGFIPFHGHALINNATVHTVSFVAQSGTVGLWLTDSSDAGVYLYARASDTLPADLDAGSVVNVDAFFGQQPSYYTIEADRYALVNNFYSCKPTPCTDPRDRPLVVSNVAPPAAVTPVPLAINASCAMDNQNGNAKLFQDSQPNAGQLIHINGPLTLTTNTPVAMSRVSIFSDGHSQVKGYDGFEVSGGILVADQKTYSTDGGFGAPDHCDWAALADAGTVTFPNGITGVWDTYSMHPCIDDGAGNCGTTGDTDYVPNSTSLTPDSGTRQYTFALYPRSCADLPGDAGAGVTP